MGFRDTESPLALSIIQITAIKTKNFTNSYDDIKLKRN